MATAAELTIVSNRLPIVMEFDAQRQRWSGTPGSGGLVSALNPILKARGGTWVGWPGMSAEQADGQRAQLDAVIADIGQAAGYQLQPVMLSADEVRGYYGGFANSVLWPLFHGFPNRCDFDPAFWTSYCQVNQKFGASLAQVIPDGQPIWVHDYHLIGVAEQLREMAAPGNIGYFLHIPFPALENFIKLPWRAQLLRSLLAYDLVGLQSRRDERNLLECVQRLMPQASIERGQTRSTVRVHGDVVTVGVFPISIDVDEFDRRARSEEVELRIGGMRQEIGPYKMLLGVDRLDYTKGLVERFRAFEELLDRHPDLIEEVIFFQLVVPSRESVAEYQALKREIDRIVGRINGRFSTARWRPIQYLYNSVDPDELAALYRHASVGVVTPLCDGMNLVSKEFCAAQTDRPGVLVLSEFAGAADEFHADALLVNPYDTVGTADAIYRAVTMDRAGRAERIAGLRRRIREHDVYRWAGQFVDSLHQPGAAREGSKSEYLPTINVPLGRKLPPQDNAGGPHVSRP